MTGRSRISALLTSIVLTVAGAGCAASDDGTADRARAGDQSASAPGDTPSPSGLPSSGDSDGDGVRTTSVSGGGVTFEVPAGFTAFDPQKLASDGADDPRFQDFLDTMGMSAEQFTQLYKYTVLFVLSRASAMSGFANNINVVAMDGPVSTGAEMRAQLEQVGMTAGESRSVSTAAGEAQVVVYQGRVGGLDVDIQGASIALGVDGKSVNITVSTTDAALTKRLIDHVLDTLTLTSATS